MKKIYIFTFLIVLLSILAVNACSRVTPTGPLVQNSTTATPLPTSALRITSQFAASSIQELAYYSDIVVIGQVVSKAQIINTARDPEDPSKPDSQFFSINQVYKVEVESVLKGESTEPLLLVQNQGLLTIAPDTNPTLDEIESEIRRNEQKAFIPLSLITLYIFFLRLLDKISYDLDVYHSTDLYAGVAEPWRFRITADEFVTPETLFPDISLCFPKKTLTDVETLIKLNSQTYTPDSSNPCNNSYPSPSTNAPFVQTPYP